MITLMEVIMKRHVSFLQGLFSAILVDCGAQYPDLHIEFRRDAKRLHSLIESRGLHFAMIDLPDCGKHFEKCLAAERLTRFEMCAMRPFRRGGVIPRLFRGLFLRVFDEHGELRKDCDVHAIRLLRQLFYAAKKYRIECSERRKRNALEQFYAIETEIRRGSQSWDLDEPEWRGELFYEGREDHRASSDPQGDLFDLQEASGVVVPNDLLKTLDGVCAIISATLGRFDPTIWRAKHGPGAVSDLRSGSDKYRFPTWDRKLENVFPYADFAFANYASWCDVVGSREEDVASDSEPPSKLILVPKTLKSPRLIASEPASHQWCQQTLKDFISTRVQESWLSNFITFRDQAGNQRLALRGSADGSLATIDLSEASDRLTCWTVERVFSRNTSLLTALHAVRTRWVSNEIHPKLPKFHRLRKFACMGSACTFPVQTVVFLSVALASILADRGEKPTIKNILKYKDQVRVFGDDIVVPTTHLETVEGLLGHLQLKVNRGKTFGTGKFRESCGLDAYGGTDVTPVYSMTYPDKSRPESVISCVATQQNMFSHGLFAVAQYLASTLRKVYSNIPFIDADSGAFGLKALSMEKAPSVRKRLDPNTHAPMMRCLTVKVKALRSRTNGHSMLLQFFTEDPQPDLLWTAGVTSRTRLSLQSGWVRIE